MKLSIIMPCYNVADTLERALDSILMQKVDFDYEILIVNDCSTDNTLAIANSYAEKYKSIKIFENEINSGNAHTFYVGLCNSQGEYFCVLDGDDYYTIPDKLQRQVDFLDKDVDEEYVATATNFIIDLGDGNISIPARSTYKEFSYADFLTQASGYYHTATYVYRNIFRGNVPEFFDNILYRGDTPRTTLHLKYSGKKVKVLDFVGSCYVFEFNGIWSSLSQKQQYEYQINYQTKHRLNVDTNFEKNACDRLIDFNKKGFENAKEEVRRYPTITIDKALDALVKYTKQFAYKEKDFMLKHFYSCEYVDTLCASIGYINQIRDRASIQFSAHEDALVIVIGTLNPGGGGIFEEICELIELYRDKKISVFSCDDKPVAKTAISRLSDYNNVQIIAAPQEAECKFQWFARKLAEIAPYRAYFYCSHDNPYGVALMQNSPCEKVVLFSFDHGYICGISSPYIDNVIAKRPVDYWMLKKKYKDKVIYIPTWGKGAIGCEGLKYIPFNNHNKLITACGAARFYKVDGAVPTRYVDLIIRTLKDLGGKHYHFGPIPQEVLDEIHTRMAELGVSKDNFVHIPWTDNIPRFLLAHNIDVFIEPFPVVSYKLTLDVLAAGVPIVVYDGLTRMAITDFVPESTPRWKNFDELIKIFHEMNVASLNNLSIDAVNYFQEFHAANIVARQLKVNCSSVVPRQLKMTDNTILEMTDSLRVIGPACRIAIYDTVRSKGKDVVSANGKKFTKLNLLKVVDYYKEYGLLYTIKKVLCRLGIGH